MKAAVYYEAGDPSVFRYESVADPVPSAGELLIQVEAISIEGGDVLNRRFTPPASVPHIVGYQAAGRVVACGAGVPAERIGERVVAFNWSGSHAELFAVPAAFAYRLPEPLDSVTASTVAVTFGTADDALFEFGGLRAGETVLIRGAAGGVGIAAVQLAAAAGARIIATASGEERRGRLQALGAHDTIDHRTDDVVAEALRLTDGKGVDLFVDMVGGSLGALVPAIRYRGRLGMMGAASGIFPAIGFAELMGQGATVYAVAYGREMHTPRAAAIIEGHAKAVANGRFSMPIDRRFPLSDAAAAHDYVERGKPFGRVAMLP